MTPNVRRNEQLEVGGARSRNRLVAAALSLSLLLTALVVAALALPATALAATPNGQVIYVGDETVTNGGYWTTDSDGSVTPYTEEGTPTDNYIHYDAADNTLTLHNATIRERVPSDTSTYVMGAGIGVFNQNDASKLTIKLEGSNAIENVSTGICVLAFSYSAGDASLTITGSGSLDTSGRNNPAIRVQSNGGNATLSIENAKVTATASSSGYGVLVQSKNDSSVSLTVDGGSLTATGSGNDGTGIQLLFGSGDSGSGTPTVTVSNNAIMQASGNADGIATNSTAATPSGTGIVFDGGTGTVYGDVTLQENITISEGESLTIPDGASLNTDGKLTVDGGTLNGTPSGDVTYKVTKVELSQSALTLDVGESETLTATITPENATNKNVTWSSDNQNVATVENGKVTAVGAGSATIKATVDGKSAECSVTVNAAAAVPVESVSLNKTELTLTEGGGETLTATITPTDAANQKVTWSSSASAVATVDATGKVTAVGAGTTIITVTTADGGKTATCKVTVEHDPAGAWSGDAGGHWHECAACGDRLDYATHTPKVEGAQGATCTEEGYTGDTVCSVCGYSIAKGETIPATGHSFTSYAPNGDATCTEDGTETAACGNGCGATDTRADEGSALGHAWGEPAWRWSDDGEEFVASFACENDPSHTLELTAAPTSEVASEPTCIEPGTTRYYAEVELDGVAYAAEATAADIPALGHKFEDGVCTVCGAKDEGYVAPQRPDPRPEPEPVETDPELPTTGDATAVGLLGAFACGGAALAIGAALRRRSR